MARMEEGRPSYDEWMYWAQVVVDRLTTISHVYSQPPHPDVFIREKERQEKLSATVAVLRHIHDLTDKYDLSLPENPRDAAQKEEDLIAALQPLFRAVLERLPMWSTDMQRLMKTPWAQGCIGKTAQILFKGPDGREVEGIGSGMIENGRLPAKIAEMLDIEAAGGDRTPRIEKPRFAESKMRREDLARLWSKSFLRTAGRID